MSIESLKRWHWALIGLLLGLLVAWTQISIGVDGMFAAGEHRTIGQRDFERGLHEAAIRGHPVIDHLTVYPDGKRFVLQMRRLERDPKFPKDGRRYRYSQYSLVTAVPYAPAIDPRKTVELSVIPAEAKVHVNLAADREGSPAKFSGWLPAGGLSRDPGTGAEVSVHLRPAEYRLTVVADTTRGRNPMDQLIVNLNGRPLPPLSPEPSGNPARWQTTIPRDGFNDQPQQVLQFSRQAEPVAIREIHLIDPKYTVLDYLQQGAPGDKPATYRFGWWVKPRATLAISIFTAVALIGGLWPTVLNLLVGAGFGRPQSESSYDLSRFKGEPEKAKAIPATMTDEDDQAMRELEERLMAGLSENGSNVSPAEELEETSATIARRELNAKAVETIPAAATPADQETDRSYMGEFYPVVRPAVEKKDQ